MTQACAVKHRVLPLTPRRHLDNASLRSRTAPPQTMQAASYGRHRLNRSSPTARNLSAQCAHVRRHTRTAPFWECSARRFGSRSFCTRSCMEAALRSALWSQRWTNAYCL
jgi:hypothetical protein